MLSSDVIKDYVKTVMLPGTTEQELFDDLFSSLVKMGMSDLISEGTSSERIEIHPSLDLRYTGQSYELNIPYSENFIAEFHSAHNTAYGYSYPDRSVEVVNLRVRAIGKVTQIRLPQFCKEEIKDTPALIDYRQVYLSETALSLPVYDYDVFIPGIYLTGPALIVSSDTTILINARDEVYVDNYLNLIIDVTRKTTSAQIISGLNE
jgi:N-methylhydantoinase A